MVNLLLEQNGTPLRTGGVPQLYSVLLVGIHVTDEVNNSHGVTPLVVVPSNNFEHVVAHRFG